MRLWIPQSLKSDNLLARLLSFVLAHYQSYSGFTMTFFSVITVFLLALPLFAAPNPSEHEARQSCNAGTLQCCADVTSVS